MTKRTMTRLENLERKAPTKHGQVFRMIVAEDDPTREERIEAFRRDHNMTDDDRLIVRVIVSAHSPTG